MRHNEHTRPSCSGSGHAAAACRRVAARARAGTAASLASCARSEASAAAAAAGPPSWVSFERRALEPPTPILADDNAHARANGWDGAVDRALVEEQLLAAADVDEAESLVWKVLAHASGRAITHVGLAAALAAAAG